MEYVISTRAVLACLLTMGFVLSGCLSGEEDDPDPAGDDLPGEQSTPVPKVTILEGSIQVSLATPLMSFNYGGEYSAELPGKKENTTGYVLVLVWDAAGPATQSLDLWVRDATQGAIPPEDPTNPIPEGPLASATGESPLVIELPADEVPDDVDFLALVRASSEQPVGVATDQPFTLVVVRFDDIPLEMPLLEEPPGRLAGLI